MGFFEQSTDQRQPVSRIDLQTAITEAVKKFSPECQAFIDVIVTDPKCESHLDADWNIKGIKFGRANRAKASEALNVVVARMAQEFKLCEDPA
jgi:hypothetical protein